MMQATLIFVLMIAAMQLVDGACKLSDKQLKSSISKFENKCLKNGFESSLPGCKAEGESKLSKKQAKNCAKNEKKLADCDTACGVDGEWGNWSEWSPCSEECGGGQRTRDRKCDTPVPAYGGKECSGSDSQSGRCNEQECSRIYTLSYTTGSGQYHDSKGEMRITLLGKLGQAIGVCSEHKVLGVAGSCVFEHPRDVGPVTYLKIENLSDDYWAFTTMEVRLGDKLIGRMQPKTIAIDDYKTVLVPLTPFGDKAIQYKIVHKTTTDQYASGAASGYLFIIVGTDGQTSSHDCEADRDYGVVGECTIEDNAEIGFLKYVIIKNTTDDYWKFNSLTINGVNMKTGAIDDYKTLTFGIN